jgi:hypothetical protein
MWQGPVAAVFLFLFLWLPVGSNAGELPRLPCDGLSPWPTYSEPGSIPNLQVVHGDASNVGWVPPECTGWKTPGFKLLLSLTAGFRFDGSGEDLLARFGAISTSRGIRYWSVADKDWKTLVTDAAALEGPDMNRRRPDFSVSEMTERKVLYFLQKDNRSTEPVIYGLQVLERAPNRLVISVENYTPVHMWLVTLFPPHEIQFLYILDAQGRGSWGLFSMLRTGLGASYLSSGHDISYVSRAVAFYRHFASILTDANPPVVWSPPEGPTSGFQASRDLQQ